MELYTGDSQCFRVLEGEGPIIICVYHTQQINHITKKDGSLVEVWREMFVGLCDYTYIIT